MTSLLQLDNLDCSGATSEQITKLFPKCRPRDVNLNPILARDDSNDNTIIVMDTDNDRCTEADEGDEGNCCDDNDDDDSSEGEDMHEEEDLIIDHTQHSLTEGNADVIVLTGTKGGTYKLRDSRIIEIAGGREVFSQSRSKAVRKSRFIDEMEHGKRNKTQGVWELRARCADSKKQRNAREVTETMFSTEVRSVRHQRQQPPENNMAAAVVGGREVVVFDDIGEEDWRGLRLDLQGVTTLEQNGGDRESSGSSSPIAHTYHRNATDFFKAVTSASDLDGDSLSPEHSNNKVARIIGNLPIAEYEGSPRRYGPRQLDVSQSHPVLPSAQSLLASPSVYPPRPGFPQRVVTTPSDQDVQPPSTTPSPSGAFDYLYEFSETRKVLEEFFKCPSSGDNGKSHSDFQELEYELRRQAGGGSAYVGQRLAKGTLQDGMEVEESPRKLGNNLPDLEDPESHFLDLSVDTGSTEDLGETEVGLQVGHSRNFTLSPETTDCDSNCGDLDSEVSLLLMESEGGPGGGGMGGGELGGGPQDSTRLYSSMPVLEDGLSSGHASDTDNNPTVLLMKRQITEIEREIVQRSSRGGGKLAVASSPEMPSVQDFLQPGKDTSTKGSLSPAEEVFTVGKSRDNSTDPELEALDPLGNAQMTPPPPAPQPHRSLSLDPPPSDSVEAAIKDIRLALQRTKTLPLKSPSSEENHEVTDSPVWVPRRRVVTNGDSDQRKGHSGEEGVEEEEADTDLETDRLLGQQRTDDLGFFDEKVEKESSKKKGRNKEVMIHEPAVLIEGVLFRARYLGSTQLVCEGQPTKTTRMMQAEEAVSRIKEAANQQTHMPGCELGGFHDEVTDDDDEDDEDDDVNSEVPLTPLGGGAAGTVFRLHFLGSVEVEEEGGHKRRKRLKKHMVEEAVTKIKVWWHPLHFAFPFLPRCSYYLAYNSGSYHLNLADK